ncbi:hypothetical protein like AT3G14470 [Hibiscus trionum]|uniref:Disease resistance protein RGA3 n=1 Tax=Hibiscus trionum TaxID=183268 RepID=A0A9W7JGU8_HIBTR|nr:hypothetical protein like AT3G14470 [Hibiscus trionum]
MADAFVSGLVSTILNNLDSLFREEVRLAGSLKTDLESLQRTFTTIQAVLHDAEQKQWKSEAIKIWLRNLEQAAYDLEDVLDDFKSEALGRGSKVSTFFSLHNPLLFRSSLAHRVKTAREKVDAIAAERMFHLEAGVGEAVIEGSNDRETSSLVDESEVFGRADEKGELVSMILSNASHHDGLSVYAICGMGGLGKTTIAQLVYNDKSVAKAFDLRIWLCVSDDFDVKRLTKAILERIEEKSCDIQDLDPLQRRLVEKLVGKQFLIVLDDVWNESRDKWDRLKQALQSGGRGSAVIVTTRLEKVALMMATVPFRRLQYLTDDDSWSLFKQRAFGMGTNEGNADLETIGRQIVQRCGGVPLAIKAIGSILSSKSQASEWLHVRDSEIWSLEDEASRILAVLRLSYEHLPSYMRQCFSFCSIFPKDYVMIKDELIGLWMANGFIPSGGPLDLHDLGCEIFSELSRRSFFQEINEDVRGTVTCKMHDLIHDVATSIKGYECCVIEPDERLKIPKTARHLFVHSSSSSTNIIDLSKLPPLRSLILDSNSSLHCNISNPSNFISNQKHLKVLDCGHRISTAAFKSLKHLRYLRLCNSYVIALSESTSSLHNLQTLNLQECCFLEMLPKGLKNLKNLRYLDLRGCSRLTSMPVGLGELTCLRKLSKFAVGKDKGGGIDELKELDLEGELSITGLCNVKNSTEAKNANLIKKQNLRSLELSWDSRESSHGNDEEVLNALQPHPSLKKLRISGYQGVRFPKWMMDLLLPNLVEIELKDCGRCDQLPALGKLRFLKVLTIQGMGSLKCVGSGFYGDMESSFPSLEVLQIKGARCLEEWTTMNGGEHFPLLRSLTISGCPKLVVLPVVQSLNHICVGGVNVTLLNYLMMNASNLTSLDLFRHGDEPMDLPDGLLRNHKHLESLRIYGTSLKHSSDLLDNLPSLKTLTVEECSELESMPRGLQNLSCLKILILSECKSLVSVAVNGLSSLRALSIVGCGNLSSLPESIQHLSSLRFLWVDNCEGLSSLPNEIQHLTSLSDLIIWNCRNMMALPQGVRSLTALQRLSIKGCPHLERRCKKHTGEDWPIIAHIPDIEIYSTSSSRPKVQFCIQP